MAVRLATGLSDGEVSVEAGILCVFLESGCPSVRPSVCLSVCLSVRVPHPCPEDISMGSFDLFSATASLSFSSRTYKYDGGLICFQLQVQPSLIVLTGTIEV